MSASVTCSQCKATLGITEANCRQCGAPAPSDPLIGRVFNQQYHLKRRLGVGGFGAVYEADEPRVGRSVAVKVLHPDFTREPILVERFRREGIAASRLEHFSAVKIFNFGETEDGLLFLVMELLPGDNLADYLKKTGPVRQESLLQFLRPVCEVLFEAHRKGIIHRDLKPQNFMILSGWNQGQIKVLDFGIARMLDAGALTKTSVVMGTPAYMAPELWDDQRVFDGRADLYALGLVVYHMLSGKFPFEASHISAWVKKHCLEAPLPLSKAVSSELFGGVEDAVMRALAKDPADRYPDALAMLSAFERALASHGPSSLTPYSLPTPPKDAKKRSWVWLAFPAAALTAVTALNLLSEKPSAKPSAAPASMAASAVLPVLPRAVQSLEWIQPRFPGEHLNSVVQTPSSHWLAFGAHGLMLRSVDQLKWEPLPKITEQDFTFAWSNSTQVLVAGGSGLLWKSADSGVTWRQQKLGEHRFTAGFALSEAEFVLGDEAGRLFVSKDRGESWTSSQALPANETISGLWGASLAQLFVSAKRPAGKRGAVYCPAGEQTWRECLAEDNEVLSVFGREGLVWASVSEKGLQQSGDQGQTWSVVEPTMTDGVLQFAKAPNGKICGVGVHALLCQEKAGEPWVYQPVHEESFGLRALWLGDDSVVAAGRGGQVWAFRVEWRLVSHAFVRYLRDILVNADGTLFAAVGDNKLWYTKDEGLSWQKASTASKFGGWAEARPPSLSTIFAAQSIVYVSGAPGVVTRLIPENNLLYQHDEFGVARISDGLYEQGRTFLASEDGLLYVLEKDSSEWASIDVNTRPLYGLAASSGFLFAVGDAGTLLRSHTNPTLWEKIGDIDSAFTLRQLTSDGTGNLYVTGERFEVVGESRTKTGAVLVSTDNGEHWRVALRTDPFAAMQSFAGQVYVLDGDKLLMSDNGTAWETMTIPGGAYFTALEILPSGQVLLAGESGTIAKLTFKKL